MSYRELLEETNNLHQERYELVMDKIKEIVEEPSVDGAVADYFKEVVQFLIDLSNVKTKAADLNEAEAQNDKIYGRIRKDNYKSTFLNPEYAVDRLGNEYGQVLSVVYSRLFMEINYVFMGDIRALCIYAELIVELYNYFEGDELSEKAIKDCVYSFMHDNSDVFEERKVWRRVDPAWDYYTQILEQADLSNDEYLYEYGLNVTDNEKKSRAHLATFSDEEIQAMADTYTEGFRIGFVAGNKDLSIKSTVQIMYPIGFERMMRAALKNFDKLGLAPILFPFSTSANKQYDFDVREDMAMWLDKAFVEYRIECLRNAYEKHKDIAGKLAGPAVIEIFGEEPFAPETKATSPKYSKEQQELFVHYQNEYSQVSNKYQKDEETSFTIISYPVADIGEKYTDIFTETVKINTLDYVFYQKIQQKIIDVLDKADRVHIVGTNGNKTDLYVKIHELKNPQKETAFENCVADVNIPVGEVFTSPVLEGTNGKLHVSQVYLRELNYLNLEIDFKDGMMDKYTCTNFEKEEDNKKYIEDNIMYHHKSLPMGEFAIGTNTTAYRMAREYDIAAKLPILIAEKTGPHFAVGDTCYSYDEDNITYNPDGKAIIARENSISALRKTDMSKAYFHCHTDITIPYDELGAITAIAYDGTETDIIRNGRFVVPGTEELNKPLDEME